MTRCYDIRKCIFIYEMDSNIVLTWFHGRAEAGKRVFDKVPGDRGKNVSTIASIALDGIRTELSIPGPIDADAIIYFVDELLAPTLNRGEIGFMDNCAIRKVEEIEEAIEANGACVIFLPLYSPDMNPIENCWSKVKSILRLFKPRTTEELLDALAKAFSSVTLENILVGLTIAAIGPRTFENCNNEDSCGLDLSRGYPGSLLELGSGLSAEPPQ